MKSINNPFNSNILFIRLPELRRRESPPHTTIEYVVILFFFYRKCKQIYSIFIRNKLSWRCLLESVIAKLFCAMHSHSICNACSFPVCSWVSWVCVRGIGIPRKSASQWIYSNEKKLNMKCSIDKFIYEIWNDLDLFGFIIGSRCIQPWIAS